MSLTLFPITALLLLLSGVGSPSHGVGYKETIAALRKQFLTAVATPSRPATHAQARAVRFVWPNASARAENHIGAVRAEELAQSGPVRPWERKQYRTRFGFAEGAYLAVGPPVPAPFATFG